MTFPDNLQKFLHALNNPNRQRIILLFADQPMLTVGKVAELTQLSMSTVSEHLKQLKEAGLLRSEKIGKEVEYRANVANIQAILTELGSFLQRCC
ncbi:MAG: metalloregulator ArsR/SmtB family transcription factor [Acinetobacter sp.]